MIISYSTETSAHHTSWTTCTKIRSNTPWSTFCLHQLARANISWKSHLSMQVAKWSIHLCKLQT